MPQDRRHTEFFGPDFARGPVLSGSPQVAAVQVAAQLAQLRVPLLRSDSDIEDHARYIRALADTLFPDCASDIRISVGQENSNRISSQIHVCTGKYTLLHCWLADSVGGGESIAAPDTVTFISGTVLQTITVNKQFLVLTPSTGTINVELEYNMSRTWYWAVAMHGRVYYSNAMQFHI